MALRPSINNIPLVQDGRHAILRIRASDRDKLERHLFQRYPHREWGTFFRFGYRRTAWGIVISYVESIWPTPGDLERQTEITTFREQYTRRAFHLAGDRGLAVGVVHSHPEGFRTFPSPLDDDMDSYLARELTAYGEGAPYCSLILQRSDQTGLTFTARIFDRGEWLPAKALITLGPVVERIHSELEGHDSHVRHLADTRESVTARLQSLMGEASRERLAAATVGVIGCSGTGSPAIEVLARGQVGEFVLVDPERMSPSNLERIHGSTWEDAQADTTPFKVEIMRRLILSINPEAKITGMVGNILHDNVLDELLRCDVLLGCTDTFHGRVVLSDLAHHFLLPSLDLGVLMEGKSGRVDTQLVNLSMYTPELPCAFCSGVIDATALAQELMPKDELAARQREAELALARGDDPDQYWRKSPRQLHTVGYLTTALGAIGAGYLEGWLTGAFECPHDRFQFDIGQKRFGVVAPPRVRQDGCNCGMHLGWGDAARPFRNVTLPSQWQRRAMRLY